MLSFSPRNGEVILKLKVLVAKTEGAASFSPRNGEVILKLENLSFHSSRIGVSVPAMGK